ncbi:dihydrodipicolinate synthase family protein [Rhodococcus sp. NPDC058521]|uniref:dihydrodipicolinate synthase family protein n=1 Tax=Rhodococcus sp. NPDC058521 TaxID=3346536 RepID=UPI00365EF50A
MLYTRSNAKTYARENMTGVWGAIPYPFTSDFELDEAGLRSNVRYYVENNLLDGIFCGHFMSEFWSLDLDERRSAAEAVVEEAAGRVPVVVQTGHHSARESVSLTHHAEQIGATYAALGNPYFMVSPTEGIYDYFKWISDRTDIGILISNTGYTGINLTPDMLNRLADLENIVAVKNPQPLEHTLETVRVAGDRLIVADPDERKWLKLITEHNFRLYTSSPAPYIIQYPGHTPIKDYTALAFNGDIEGAKAIADTLDAQRDLMDKWLHHPWGASKLMPIANLKVWTEALGMAAGPVRAPLTQMDDAARDELHGDLRNIGLPLTLQRA